MGTGERIRSARKKRGMTQKQLGQACGIDEANIRKYEADRQNPKFETLQKIASALGVSIAKLLPDDYLVPYEDVADAIKQDMIDNAASPEEYEEAINTNVLDIQRQLLLGDIQQRQLQKIIDYFYAMNEEGQEKAVESVEIIAGNPRYQNPKPSK